MTIAEQARMDRINAARRAARNRSAPEPLHSEPVEVANPDVATTRRTVTPKGRGIAATITMLKEARAILSAEPEPLHGIRSLSDILDSVDIMLRRYVHFATPEQSWAVALWAAHTHLAGQLGHSPRLIIRAPMRGSGKTRTLEVLAALVARPWGPIVGPTEAVLFRKIERDHPTVLLDEADRLFEKRAEDVAGIVGVLNAGHAAGAIVPRVQMPKGNLQDWHVYGPMALAGIGKDWPDTLLDRSIIIDLERKTADEPVDKLWQEDQPWLAEIGIELGVWALEVDNFRVPVPEMTDRAEDNWRPLVSIAASAGGHWPERARQAALALSAAGAIAVEDDRAEIVALRDVRRVFTDEADPPFLGSIAIVSKMRNLDESPWNDDVRPLSTAKLAKLLRKFRIHSLRPERGDPSGYRLAEVEQAWHRLQIDPVT